MTDLSSCYFCGTALDAPVASYPVVPKSIPTDDDHTVSLCPSCRGKLSEVVEIVLTAAGDAGDADSVPTTLEENDELDGETARADDSTTAADNSTAAAADDSATDADSDDSAGERTASDESADSAETMDADETAEAAGAAQRSDEEPVDVAESAAESSEPAGASADGAGQAAPTADSGGGRPEVLSTAAAKKVIRLLQNREFPLDREEFEVVASNAYDIPQGECVEVIDALVSEGYVAEDGGRLVRE